MKAAQPMRAMIQIIPSISIYNGKCVKVAPGDFEHPEIYDVNPIELAQTFEDHGIKRVQLIDLDGSKKGRVVNYNILRMIASYTNLEIDFTGGIQTDSDVRIAFENGAKYITAGTVAATERKFFSSWIVSYGREKIVLAADAQNGKIMTRGWQKITGIDLMELIGYYADRGVKYIKCTDVSRDGTLEGPSFDLYKKILSTYPDIYLIASGGVSSLDDIIKLEEMGVHGVMFGKAYYEGKIDLKDLERLIVQQAS
jgi:phosphoribosylformimino-5-aminoimidazole carboxamide ribotide isomerase